MKFDINLLMPEYTSFLLAAIKAQQKEIDQLKQEVELLKSK